MKFFAKKRVAPKKEDNLLPTLCSQEFLKFHPLEKCEVRGGIDGGAITSDVGGLLLREVERRTGTSGQFAGCFRDLWQPERIEHRVENLVAQRVCEG